MMFEDSDITATSVTAALYMIGVSMAGLWIFKTYSPAILGWSNDGGPGMTIAAFSIVAFAVLSGLLIFAKVIQILKSEEPKKQKKKRKAPRTKAARSNE
jgi:hypothetical protein